MKIKSFLLHLFTPQETNNFKAKTLQLDFLSFYLIGALCLVFIMKLSSPLLSNVLGFATDISTAKLYTLVNEERAKQSLPPLTYNSHLETAALNKANDMLTKNYWAHFGPDGASPWNFILQSGYQYEYAGENLAKNFLFSQGVVDAWMNSPTHRDNILKKEYSEVGFAIVNGILNGEETTLVVQMFGTPLNQAPAQHIQEKPVETVSPIPSPQVESKPLIKQPAVLGKIEKNPTINLFPITLDVTSIFIFFFIVTLFADFYIASKLQVIRIGGKHIAHLIFIGFIAISILLILKKGTIL